MKRAVALTILTLALSISRSVPAGELPAVKPEAVGMSSEKLGLVAPAMKQFVEKQRVAGAVTVVARKGKIVLFEAVGRQDIEAGTPMHRDTIVRIYSMTKPITSVAIMMLVEDGKLALNDPVAKHLPAFADAQVLSGVDGDEVQLEDARRPPTLRDLLRHTSGLTYGIFGNTVIDQRYRNANILGRDNTLAEMATKLCELPLLYQPGTRFNYSVSTDLLGRVVEVASGQSFDAFLQERILTPLDMKDTGFSVPDSKLDRFATNYGWRLAGGLRIVDAPQESGYRQAPKFLSGGGGMVSTARDYIRFCQMLLNQGEVDGTRLLRAETVAAMTRNQLSEEAYPINLNGKRPGVGFGLGFSVVVEQAGTGRPARVGEYGWGGAASTHFWISPKDELAVVVLTQLMPFTFQMEHAVKPLVYDAIVGASIEEQTKVHRLSSSQRAAYDAFVYVNRIPPRAGDGESAKDLAGRIFGRLANQEGRILLKLPTGMDRDAYRGLKTFLRYEGDTRVGNCVACHAPIEFTDRKTHVVTQGGSPEPTPSLRNLQTRRIDLQKVLLEKIAASKQKRSGDAVDIDDEYAQMKISKQDVPQLVAFLQALNDVSDTEFRKSILNAELLDAEESAAGR